MSERTRAVVTDVEVMPPRFRQRPQTPPTDYLALCPEGQAATHIYMRRQVLADLTNMGQRGLPNEGVGKLFGRVWQDGQGEWVAVAHLVAALPDECETSPGHCSITPEGNLSLLQRAECLFPLAECVGWAHSHIHDQSAFSTLDLAEQGAKPHAWLGLLAYRRHDATWEYSAFLGPHSIPLHADPASARLTSDTTTPPDHVPPTKHTRGRTGKQPTDDLVNGERQGRLLVAAAAVLVACWAAGLMVVLSLYYQIDSRLASLADKPAATEQVERPLPRATTVAEIPHPALDWTCGAPGAGVTGGGPYLTYLRCVGPADGAVSGWFWDFGDGELASGWAASHRYAAPGSYSVTLSVRLPDGITPAGSRTYAVGMEREERDDAGRAPDLERLRPLAE